MRGGVAPWLSARVLPGPRLPRARPIDLAWFIFSCASRGHKWGLVVLGDCVDYVGGVEQLGLRTLLFLHAAAGAAGAQALRGQRKGAPSLGGFRSSLRPCIFVFPFLFQYVGSN